MAILQGGCRCGKVRYQNRRRARSSASPAIAPTASSYRQAQFSLALVVAAEDFKIVRRRSARLEQDRFER